MDCTVYKDACSAAEVRGYPTLKAFYRGAEIDAHGGARELPALKAFVVNAVKKSGK